MSRYTHKTATFAPFYIHSFPFAQPHCIAEAEKFELQYADPSQIERLSDKLRWYRYKSGLLQREVADAAALSRTTYANYEEFERDYYPIEAMMKIAELLSVPVTELLDDYNLFLYRGQGRNIKQMRKVRHMTQREFARRLGVPLGTLKEWEQDRIRISKRAWENLMLRG